jgi:hypothetical protein
MWHCVQFSGGYLFLESSVSDDLRIIFTAERKVCRIFPPLFTHEGSSLQNSVLLHDLCCRLLLDKCRIFWHAYGVSFRASVQDGRRPCRYFHSDNKFVPFFSSTFLRPFPLLSGIKSRFKTSLCRLIINCIRG